MLADHDLVIGPSADGGYYLIAMTKFLPSLFVGIEWSSTKVLSQTLEIVAHENISCGLLPELNDVDELGDLQALMTKLESNHDALSQELVRAIQSLEISIG